jgi:hypothetical protein
MKVETTLTRANGLHIKIIITLWSDPHSYVVTLKTKQKGSQTWIKVHLPMEEDAANGCLARYIDGNELYAAKLKMWRMIKPEFVGLRQHKHT